MIVRFVDGIVDLVLLMELLTITILNLYSYVDFIYIKSLQQAFIDPALMLSIFIL